MSGEGLDPKQLAVGQRIYYRDARAKRDDSFYEYMVTKIGRAWVTFGLTGDGHIQGRISLETGCAYHGRGDYRFDGTFWESPEHWKTWTKRQKWWLEFREQIYRTHHHPQHLTEERIGHIAALLGIELKVKEDA